MTMVDSKYVVLTEKNFKSQVLDSTRPVVVDFWADWCGPCHMIAQVIEMSTAEFEGQIRVGKVDFDGNSQVAQRYAIRSLPTLLLFKDGNVLDRIIGALPKPKIAAKLNALLQLERAKGGLL